MVKQYFYCKVASNCWTSIFLFVLLEIHSPGSVVAVNPGTSFLNAARDFGSQTHKKPPADQSNHQGQVWNSHVCHTFVDTGWRRFPKQWARFTSTFPLSDHQPLWFFSYTDTFSKERHEELSSPPQPIAWNTERNWTQDFSHLLLTTKPRFWATVVTLQPSV